MNRSLRLGALVIALAALSAAPVVHALPGFGEKKARPPVAAGLLAPPHEWPQSRSDLTADPLTLFGSLPNGMRYAIRRQAIPAGQAAFRLRFGVGSLMEADDQQGLAHFLEHMAFNGSKAVPEGEMVKTLERLGLAFGADTNASTGFSQTIYKLDLPRTDPETVDTSLMLLRETASNLTIDPAAVDRERGIVLSEERARDTPAYRIYQARLAFLMPGQRLPTRYPIGKVETLQSAPASRIRDLYSQYYRPERAVLVAVGDFDPAQMEAKIKARFGDWTAVGEAGGEPDRGAVAERKTEAKLLIEPGAPLSLQFTWMRPHDRAPDTQARRRQEFITQVGLAVLNRRFFVLARAAEPPFIGAGAFKSDQEKSAEMTSIIVSAEPDRWRAALAAADLEQRRAVRHGVRQEEVDREIEEVRAFLKAAVAGAATRRPSDLAAEILNSVDDDEVVTDPASDLALFESIVKGLKADTVSAALKTAFRGGGPLLFMASPQAIDGGEAALLKELDAARKVETTAPSAITQTSWPYDSFGEPTKVVETRDVTDLDTVFVRFENGVRLTVKPTQFRDDEVLVRVNIGNGLKDLPKDRTNAAWGASAFTEGGLKQITNDDMERVLASRLYGARFGVSEESLVLTGGTRTEDLETQLQVLTAYVAEPGWRPEAFQRLKASSKTIHDQYEATASGVLSRDLAGLLHGGDGRWAFPTRDEMSKTTQDDLRAQIDPQLANGAIEVVIVGDITVEKATEAVARTFGALPARAAAAPTPASQLAVGFPAAAAAPVALKHKGRGDQSIGYIAWPTSGLYANPQLARETNILGEVMGLRLIEELREAQGTTYSPSVTYQHSTVWPTWGYLSASVEVPPTKLPEFFADVRRITADLRAKPVSADELARAKKPRLDRIERVRVTNQYWLGELSGAQTDPRRLESIRQILPGTERVTAADVQHAAQTYLRDDKAFDLVVKP